MTRTFLECKRQNQLKLTKRKICNYVIAKLYKIIIHISIQIASINPASVQQSMAKLVMAREERTLTAAEAGIMAIAVEQAKTKALINGLAQRPKPTIETASGDKAVLKQQYDSLVKQVYVCLRKNRIIRISN